MTSDILFFKLSETSLSDQCKYKVPLQAQGTMPWTCRLQMAYVDGQETFSYALQIADYVKT